ncbi:class I adenylate-forming enzyme family protein [Rhodococcus rhodochrous]|uniref:class I adenylate-forming enzyme family protein n=1 Tax=Rhodococcus rhodochrous TaxID=1829 RepID=UPI003FD28359
MDNAVAARYKQAGWWGTRSLGQVVADHAKRIPAAPAFIAGIDRTSWRDYDVYADAIAAALVGAGIEPGERVGVLLPDTADVHAALVGTERAGLVAMGIGARAGDAEITHLLRRSGAVALITRADDRGRDIEQLGKLLLTAGLSVHIHFVIGNGQVQTLRRFDAGSWREVPIDFAPHDLVRPRALGPDDVSMLNSTSGTTGLPKCVVQFQNRWMHFSQLAIEAGELGPDDVFLAAVPAPFGFGLWTSHFAPTLLGTPAVLLPRFSAEEMVRKIEEERVTVLFCVSTQFRMLLASDLAEQVDLSSLRVMFTGGEAVPYADAARFEDRTGATVLQFFGSNESGAFSYTTTKDPREKRLTTAGRIVPSMTVRLYDAEGRDITASGGPGQPGGTGPLLSMGYYDDPAANDELYAPDGSLLMGDLVTIDDSGYLTVVGRKAEIIIRGGKNISAAHVEREIETHPNVEMAVAVGLPDNVFGERLCAVISGSSAARLTLPGLNAHLVEHGMTKEYLPEYLLVVDEIPRSSGGKLAKGQVRELALAALAAGELEVAASVGRLESAGKGAPG